MAVAVKNAGMDDLFENGNLKKWGLFGSMATMRWGHPYVDYSVQGEDYRDLLQLRLDGAGDYHVVMFPRFRDEPAPQFTTLDNGTVIKVSDDAGTHYCFLPSRETTVTAEQAEFRGIVGSPDHQHRPRPAGKRPCGSNRGRILAAGRICARGDTDRHGTRLPAGSARREGADRADCQPLKAFADYSS
jgi:hypothetical protein